MNLFQLTRISHNAVFSRNQNVCYTGNLRCNLRIALFFLDNSFCFSFKLYVGVSAQPFSSSSKKPDQDTTGRGGWKLMGTRVHATEYEIYVTKYLLVCKKTRANSGNIRNNVF